MNEIAFDDVAALQAAVSEDFGPFGEPIEITQAKIDAFAELTGDHQWIHVDVERAARESPFGGTIAHGFFTLSLLPALRAPNGVKIVGYGSAANYGADGLRFVSPVPAGASVHARSRIAEVVEKPKGTLVTTETAIHVVGQERPALSYRGLVLYRPPRG